MKNIAMYSVLLLSLQGAFTVHAAPPTRLATTNSAGDVFIQTRQIFHEEYNEMHGFSNIEIYVDPATPDTLSVLFSYCSSDQSGCSAGSPQNNFVNTFEPPYYDNAMHFPLSMLKRNLKIRTDAQIVIKNLTIPQDLFINQDQFWASKPATANITIQPSIHMRDVNIGLRANITGRSKFPNYLRIRNVRMDSSDQRRNAYFKYKGGSAADYISVVNSEVFKVRMRLLGGENELCIQGSDMPDHRDYVAFGNDQDYARVIDSPQGVQLFGYKGIDTHEYHNASANHSGFMSTRVEEYDDCPSPVTDYR